MIRLVCLSVRTKTLSKLPKHVLGKLPLWIHLVGEHGLEAVRRVSGFHDEPLHGPRAGQRSIRLNRSYRAFYRVAGEDREFIDVFDVNRHEY
jgi:toxin HigB-1